MIAYLDTCSILNLIQVNYDDEYLKYLNKTFDTIKIAPMVFEELERHKYDNIVQNPNKDIIDNIINQYLINLVERSDYSKCLEFTEEKNIGCFKSNGESHSIGYSVNTSRFGKVSLGENLLKTHFISDDAPAKKDFEYFYQINVAGQILNSIDVMTIFMLKDYITKAELIDFCRSLKNLYCKEIILLKIELESYRNEPKKNNISNTQDILFTQLIELLTDFSEDSKEKITEITTSKYFKPIMTKNKGWKQLIDLIQKKNYRKKIPYINKRLEDIEKVWI